MMISNSTNTPPVYVVTGPTSGIGRETALQVARRSTVVLVGRNSSKLNEVQKTIQERGGKAIPVVCDLSNMESVRRTAAQIAELNLPIAGLLNNAGVMLQREAKTAQGWDMTFATKAMPTNYSSKFRFRGAIA